MQLMLALVAMSSLAWSAPLRPAVTGVTEAQSVHVLFGPNGETTSSCVEVAGGWLCEEVDVTGPVDVHLLVDTTLTVLGQTEIDGPFLSIDNTDGGAKVSWRQTVEAEEGHGDSLVIIRVINADAKQAPMLRLRAANKRMEAGCADDGQFPDGTPNDGQYHCTSIIRTQDLQSQTWTLEVLVPTPDGEEDSLGVFSYEGKPGLYFATVKMGDASAARPDPFAVVGPLGSRADDGADSSVEDQENKPPLDELHGGPGSQGGHSSIHLWLVALGALGLGWLLGTRTRHRRWSIDAATPIPVSAIDERGPIPEPGVAFISSAQPSHTLLHVARQLMERRRIVVVGGPERMDLDPIHSVFWVTDPDQHAIETAVQQLLVDGGVPPVLLVLGMESVLDTGGASPSPTHDMLQRLGSVIWCAVFVGEDTLVPEAVSSWGYDPQAGWSKL